MIPPNDNKPSVASAINEAQNIIDAAKLRAEKMLQEAKESVRAIHEKGYQDGFIEGKKKAISLSVKLIKDHSLLRKKIADEAAQLSYQIIENVFQAKSPHILQPLKELAKRMVHNVSIGKKIDLVVHPSNKNILTGIERELTDISRNCELYVVEYEEIPIDSILVKTDFGEIQVSLSELLSEICSQVDLPHNANKK